jgi:hypothetical protein
VPLFVQDLDDRAEGRAPDAGGFGTEVLGRRDRGIRRLGGAVEVVDDVAEGVHHLQRKGTTELRAAALDDAQRRQVVLPDGLLAEVEDALEHDGDDDQARARVCRQPGEDLLWVESAPGHHSAAQPQAQEPGLEGIT